MMMFAAHLEARDPAVTIGGLGASRPGGICAGGRRQCANSGRSATARPTGQIDPLPIFKIGPMNGREARESGLRLKPSVRCPYRAVDRHVCRIRAFLNRRAKSGGRGARVFLERHLRDRSACSA